MAGWTCSDSSRRRRLDVIAAGMVLLIVGTGGCGPQAPPRGAAQAGKGTATVTLEIDLGDGRKKQFAALPWRASMTAIDVLAAARDGASGPPFDLRGSGGTAFIVAIDGISNAGASERDRNWLYRINGQLGTVGAGVATVQAGDRVLWEYAVRE